jgi:hypothetical protein
MKASRLQPRLAIVVTLMFAAKVTDAQTDTTHRAPGARVRGFVVDSIAHTALARATVQLVAADDPSRFALSTESDSSGQFAFEDVQVGQYRLGFFHEMLDSLGVDPPLKEVKVVGTKPVIADLGIPSAARLRKAICGAGSSTDSGAVITGIVRDGKGAAAPGVTVSGDWLEYSIGSGGITRRMARRTSKSADNGWYALCNVPSGGIVALVANLAADSTGLIEVQVPPEGFLRREIYLGTTKNGRLTGTVVSAIGYKPLADAQVSVVNGPQTRTNERGEFTITNAPEGTRMIEVRAIGYYPDRRHVNLVQSSTPVRIMLSTLKAVLDTVRIRASRLALDEGFLKRKRIGLGKFITPEDIMKFSPINTTDLFKRLPGIRVDTDTDAVKMRGAFEPWCTASVFIDGQYMSFLTIEDIDAFVPPQRVAGIEVYSGTFIPAEFHVGLNGCGSIAIWTKRG